MSVGGNDLLTQIENEYPKLGQYLRHSILPAIDTLGKNVGASSSGTMEAPDAPQSVSINKQGDENVQVTINHTSKVSKGVEYFTEVATDAAFTNPRVEHHGASRSPASTIFLPTKDSSGKTHSYYFRSYAQQPGGKPSKVCNYSGNPVTMSGGTQADHTASTGSGTASNNGGQGGSGWGKVLNRPAEKAKRSV